MFRHAAEYRRTHKKPLVLGLLGLNWNAALYLNEQLTKENYNIFKKAMTMKKQKLLSAVFSRRGFVHVRVHAQTSRLAQVQRSSDEHPPHGTARKHYGPTRAGQNSRQIHRSMQHCLQSCVPHREAKGTEKTALVDCQSSEPTADACLTEQRREMMTLTGRTTNMN